MRPNRLKTFVGSGADKSLIQPKNGACRISIVMTRVLRSEHRYLIRIEGDETEQIEDIRRVGRRQILDPAEKRRLPHLDRDDEGLKIGTPLSDSDRRG